MHSAEAGRPTIRPQYHLRPTAGGIDAFDVRRLITLSQHLPVRMIDPDSVAELDRDHWYFQGRSRPTPRSIVEHLRLVLAADLRYPIILDQDGRLMDGMHRVCKALLEGVREIPAVRFIEDPQPDFVDCDPDLLPYHD
ncbi:MAG: hypothetical protein ING50_13860 [Burkholderiales bacterium]|jgi:hypothetical protein|nr:hypothetical protein [Burkholderiales bacterium]